jgi:hypothetical protein
MEELEFFCLNAVTDDYENLQSIESLVSRESKRKIDRQAIGAVMNRLCNLGLVVAYHYDQNGCRFLPQNDGSLKNFDALWFYVSSAGREVLEARYGS